MADEEYEAEAYQPQPGPDYDTGVMGQSEMAGSDPLVSIENMRYIEGNEELDDIKEMLSGMHKQPDGSWVRRPGEKGLMNRKGVDDMIMIIKGFYGKGAKLSDIEEYNVSRIIKGFARMLARNLRHNMSDYGLARHNYIKVHSIICDSVYFSIRRSKEAHEKRFLRNAQVGVMSPMAANIQQSRSWRPFKR